MQPLSSPSVRLARFWTSFSLALLLLVGLASMAAAARLDAFVSTQEAGGVLQTASEVDPVLANPSLVVPPGTGAFGPTFVEAYGDESGAVRVFARTGALAAEADASIVWSETIRKDQAGAFFEFSITPGYLEILHSIPQDGFGTIRPPTASMSIDVFEDFGAGVLFFEHGATIEGIGGTVLDETFELVTEVGGFTGSAVYTENVIPIPPFIGPDVVDRVRYDTPALTGLVDLSDLAIGETRVVGYIISVAVAGDGMETAVSAFIGDPLDANSGITTRFFGVSVVPEPGVGALLLVSLAAVAARASRPKREA